MQVRAVKSPIIQSRPGPRWLLSVSKFEVPLAWNEISGRWWAQGCYRGLVWGPNRRLLFQRHRLLKRKVGQMHCSKGGLYWKIMLKPSSNLWVKPEFYELIELPSYVVDIHIEVLRHFQWVPTTYTFSWRNKKIISIFLFDKCMRMTVMIVLCFSCFTGEINCFYFVTTKSWDKAYPYFNH